MPEGGGSSQVVTLFFQAPLLLRHIGLNTASPELFLMILSHQDAALGVFSVAWITTGHADAYLASRHHVCPTTM